MTYIKSPLHYVGGKFKLLPQIIPLFPNDIETFVDVFCGGGNVFANVNAEKYICNDLLNEVIEIISYFKNYSDELILNKINSCIIKYNLDNKNEEEYYNLRNIYNYNKENNVDIEELPIILYVLICHCYNNQIRFNNKGEFNLPFGFRRFNDNTKNELINFIDRLNVISNRINLYSMDFDNFLKSITFDKSMFFYIDPPYLITSASYNNKWDNNQEEKLLNWLLKIDDFGCKFALSNIIECNGKQNEILIHWIKDNKNFNIHHLNQDYNHCSYNKKVKSKNDEILITNY